MESDLGARLAQLRAMIDEHPWELVGAAALFGAWLAFEPPRVRVREPSIVLSIIGAVALRFAREAAFRHAADIAKRWWDESEVGPDREAQAGGQNGRGDGRHARPV